jgi:hypothetical protein
VRRSIPFLLVPCLALAASVVANQPPPPNLPRAIDAQRALVADRPTDPAALNDLGNLLRLAGHLAEAEEAYRRAVAVDPQRATARFNLALLLQQRGAAGEALAELKQVLEIDPGHAWAHYQTGVLLERKGQKAAAIRAYAQAFALNPELAFPGVNPHVIENTLLTEALIRSYSVAPPTPQAPNAYEDPGRIASLLVPPPAAPAAAETPSPARQPTPEERAATSPPPGREERERDPALRRASTFPPKVLSEESLDPGRPVGQVAPPSSGPQRGGMRSGPSAGTTTWAWPRSNTTGAGAAQPGRGSTAGAGRPTRVNPPQAPAFGVPGDPRFRPGVRSTGSLDNEILPPRPAAERAG